MFTVEFQESTINGRVYYGAIRYDTIAQARQDMARRVLTLWRNRKYRQAIGVYLGHTSGQVLIDFMIL